MAFLTIPNVNISGMAVAVPKEIQALGECRSFVPGEAEKVSALTGIIERHIAPEGKVCSDYCVVAAEKLIESLGWEKETVDGLIYVSVSRDYIEPNTANVIQGRLGLPRSCYAIDVPMACTGYCYGLSLAASLLTTGSLKRVLLMVGDTQSKLVSPLDKTLWPLTGDAGTVTALEYKEGAKPMYFHMAGDGKRYEAIIAPSSGVREPTTSASLEDIEIDAGVIRNRTHMAMDGMSVFSFAISTVPKSIVEFCEHFNIEMNSCDYLLLHQANKYIDEKIRKRLKFTAEQTPYSIEHYGNTSSGTIPMTMVSQLADVLLAKPCKLLMCGFGAGLAWSSVYVETDSIKVLPVIEY